MRARLELLRGDEPAPWPRGFASDICDELCSAVDEALTLEDALRMLLRRMCERMRWNAGRARHRDVRPAWYVDRPATIVRLRPIIQALRCEERTVAWDEPWTVTERGELWAVVFPIEWATGAWLELYATEPSPVHAGALDDVARALVPAGALLHRKRSGR